MNFLKCLWRKLFPVKIYRKVIVDRAALKFGNVATEAELVKIRKAINLMMRDAYDPSQDPEKLLRGEVESYFD